MHQMQTMRKSWMRLILADLGLLLKPFIIWLFHAEKHFIPFYFFFVRSFRTNFNSKGIGIFLFEKISFKSFGFKSQKMPILSCYRLAKLTLISREKTPTVGWVKQAALRAHKPGFDITRKLLIFYPCLSVKEKNPLYTLVVFFLFILKQNFTLLIYKRVLEI